MFHLQFPIFHQRTPPPYYRKTIIMPCGWCHKDGHNKRTCEDYNVVALAAGVIKAQGVSACVAATGPAAPFVGIFVKSYGVLKTGLGWKKMSINERQRAVIVHASTLA